MNERSLIRRVLVGIILAELVCAAALLLISIVHEQRVRLRAIDVSLEGRADSLFGAVQDAEDAGDNVVLDPREVKIPRGDLFAVYDAGGRVIGSSPQISSRLPRAGESGLHNRRLDGRSYRVLERNNLRIIDRPENGGAGLERPVTIVYATPLDRLWHEVFEGIGFYLAASLLLILVTTAVMVQLMRRLLRPLEELAVATAAVTPRDLRFSAPTSALALRELRPLASTLSAVIEQLHVAFERQHRFLGDAAHELKTAVAVVRSSLQLLLLRSRATGATEAELEGVVRDNLRVEDLISRMLLLARLEEQTDGEAVHADINAAAEVCLQRLAPVAERAGVMLRATVRGAQRVPCISGRESDFEEAAEGLQEHRLVVRASADDLEVLLSNLLLNAIEHSAHDSTVKVELTRAGSSALLRVADRGEGIPPEALEHIFERFYRADLSRARQTGGAGLGLSICQAIVQSADGTIAIESSLGRGTSVTVTLPLHAARTATARSS